MAQLGVVVVQLVQRRVPAPRPMVGAMQVQQRVVAWVQQVAALVALVQGLAAAFAVAGVVRIAGVQVRQRVQHLAKRAVQVVPIVEHRVHSTGQRQQVHREGRRLAQLGKQAQLARMVVRLLRLLCNP